MNIEVGQSFRHGGKDMLKRHPLPDVPKTYCLESRSSLIGTADGNMLSYAARASRTNRARSSSDFGINRMTSPIFAPKMSYIMPSRRSAHRLGRRPDLYPRQQ